MSSPIVPVDLVLNVEAFNEALEAATERLGEFGGDAEESAAEATKGMLETELSTRTLEKGFRQIGKAVKAFADGLVYLTKLAGEQDRRVYDLGKSYEGLEEQLGKSVASSEVWQEAIEATSGLLEDLTKVVASPEGKQAINDFFAIIARGAGDALNATIGLIRIIKDLKDEFEIQFGQGFVAESLNEKGQTPFEALIAPFESFADRLNVASQGGVGTPGKKPPKKGGGKKKAEPTGRIGTSSLTESFSAPELGAFDLEILKANDDLFKEFDEQRFNDFVESNRRFAEEQDKKMRQMTEIAEEEERIRQENLRLAKDYHINLQQLESANTDKEVEQLVESSKKRREVFDITLGLIQSSAQLTVNAVRAGIDALVEAAVTGQKFSSKAFASIIADMMIQQGWAFQSQAIAYTFEAIANYGSTAWRAAAMGSAAKTMLIAGYALKAKFGGSGGNAAPSSGGSGGGGAGRGAGGGGGIGSFPSAPRPTSSAPGQETPAIVYNINIGIAGGDGRKVAQDIRRVLRDGGAAVPSRRRAA